MRAPAARPPTPLPSRSAPTVAQEPDGLRCAPTLCSSSPQPAQPRRCRDARLLLSRTSPRQDRGGIAPDSVPGSTAVTATGRTGKRTGTIRPSAVFPRSPATTATVRVGEGTATVRPSVAGTSGARLGVTATVRTPTGKGRSGTAATATVRVGGSRWCSSKDPSNGDLHPAPPHIQEPTIPPYEEKVGEPIHLKRARLQYQSRKRGMLENGLLLSTFAHRFLPTMTESQLAMYDRLINLPSNDWEIFYWATGVRPTPQEFDNEIMTMLKDFVKNSDRENRTVQPNLH